MKGYAVPSKGYEKNPSNFQKGNPSNFQKGKRAASTLKNTRKTFQRRDTSNKEKKRELP